LSRDGLINDDSRSVDLAEITTVLERYERLFNEAPIPYQSLDASGRLLEVNQAWCDALGYRQAEVLGKWFGDFMTPEHRAGFSERFPNFLQQGSMGDVEIELVRKDGSTRLAIFDGVAIKNPQSEFLYTHCVFRDVTDQLAAQRRLVKSEARFHSVFSNVATGMAVLGAELQLEEANPALGELLGYSLAELAGISFWKLVHANQQSAWRAVFEHFTKDNFQSYREERLLTTKSGREKCVVANISAFGMIRTESPIMFCKSRTLPNANRPKSRLRKAKNCGGR